MALQYVVGHEQMVLHHVCSTGTYECRTQSRLLGAVATYSDDSAVANTCVMGAWLLLAGMWWSIVYRGLYTQCMVVG